MDVRTRLARLLLELAAQETPRPALEAIVLGPRLTQTDLADMLGATRESINKWLRVYERKGILRTGRGRITLIDLEALRRDVS